MSGKRISLYMPESLDDSLNLVSSRMGISKSILVTTLLERPVQDLIDIFAEIPEKPNGAEVLRFKGKSRDVIEDRVSNLHKLMDDLHV